MENQIDCSFNYTSNWLDTMKARWKKKKQPEVTASLLKYLCLLPLLSGYYFIDETYSTDKTTRHN